MGYKNVRAIKPVRHNNVLRVPGQTTGASSQDFVASDAAATRLVELGVVTILGVAAEPEIVEPVGRIFARKRGGQVIGLQDENGLALAAGGASSILSITGAPGVGNVYAAVLAAGWGGTPTYQWLRGVSGANDLTGATNIAGATASTYVQVEADAGCLIGCRVAGVTQYSAAAPGLVPAVPVEPVVGVAPAFTSAPAIIGTPTVGVPVAFTPGVVTGTTPITKAVQWLLDGAQIVGETGATYTPISGDATKTLSVRETASNGTAPSAVSTSGGVVVGGAGGGLVAAQTYDFTSSMPADWTFARASTTEAIQGTAFAPISSGAPRIESWGGVSRGVAVDGVTTNRCQNGSNPTAWGSITNITATTATGQALPDGTTGSVAQFAETVTTGNHTWTWNITGASAGVCTFWTVWRNVGAVQRNLVLWAQDTAVAAFRPDLGGYAYSDPTRSDVTGTINLADGWQLSWVTYDLGVTAPTFIRGYLRPLETVVAGSNAGDTAAVVQFWHAQHVAGRRLGPRIVVPSTTAVASIAETLSLGSLTGISTSTGTFVIEHDGAAAVALITSGGNTIATAAASTKTGYQTQRLAVAYSPGASFVVSNGGAQSTGSALIFGSSLAVAAGVRIKRIRWYAAALTEAEMQALTAAPVVGSAGVANALRVAAHNACLPFHRNGPCGSLTHAMIRFSSKVGSGARRNLGLSFDNWWMSDTSGETANTNAVELYKVSLHINGVTVLLTWDGSPNVNMAPGAAKVMSDLVPASEFGLTEFAVGLDVEQRVEFVLPDSGSYITASHYQGSSLEALERLSFNPAATTVVNGVEGTGPFTFTGTAPITNIYTATPRMPIGVLMGEFTTAAGDPKTYILTGASVSEPAWNYIRVGAKMTTGGPSAILALAKGGANSRHFYNPAPSRWTQYLEHARVGLTELGVNDASSFSWHSPIWAIYRGAPSIAHIAVVKHVPIVACAPGWTTYDQQTKGGTSLTQLRGRRTIKAKALDSGYIDSIIDCEAGIQQSPVRDDELWLTDGVTPNLMTLDGGHPTESGHTILAPSAAAHLDAIQIPS